MKAVLYPVIQKSQVEPYLKYMYLTFSVMCVLSNVVLDNLIQNSQEKRTGL